jgi:hypothetical protein
VIHEALRLMRSECEATRQADIWGVFECRIVRPMFEGASPVEYGELVRRFAFQSPSQAGNALITAKRKYGRALRAVIAEYARDEAEVESEIRELRAVLARG